MVTPPGPGAGESHDVDRPNVDVLPVWVATKIWFAISLQTFGGPAGQIAVMQRILVEEKRWIEQQRFLLAPNGASFALWASARSQDSGCTY